MIDGKPHPIYDENTGAPKIDISGSEYYRLPGHTTDFISGEGSKVKVIPEGMYNQLPDAYKAGVKMRVEKELEKPVDIDGSGESNFSPDSEYADMLRRNIAYNDLLNQATNSYKFTTPDDKSFERKNILAGRELQRENLGIAKQRLSLSQQAMQMRKDRIAKGLDPNGGLPDFLSSMADEYGEDVEVQDGEVVTKKPWWQDNIHTPT
jgi:hypothetical protein